MYMKGNIQGDVIWPAIKWILGVFAGIGFYLMAWAFNNFTSKLDKVYDATISSEYRLKRLEDDHKDLRDYVNKRYQSNMGSATEQMFRQGLKN